MVSSARVTSGPETIRILTQSANIKHEYLSLVRSASREILVIFPTPNAVRREEKIGIMDELRNARGRGVDIRILTPEDDFIKIKLDRLKEAGISVRKIESPSEAKFKLLIVDRKTSLVVETANDSKSEFLEAVGLATISSSKPTVLPYVTIFESFWREADLYEKAAQADKIKDDFVNIAAHELRTPITPIIAAIEFIEKDFADIATFVSKKGDDQTKKKVDKIQSNHDMVKRNTRKLLRLAEDILQVSRIHSGSFSLNLQTTCINSIVLATIEDIKKKYEYSKPNVHVQFIPSPALRDATQSEIYCDASKIAQALFNILDNAMKFMVAGTILVEMTQEGEELVLLVRDCGPGIDPSILERIFEKFVAKSDGGTGLGLYLCKKIIEAHGGRIWAQNNSGQQGASITFTLPTNLKPADTAEPAVEIESVRATT